MAFSAVESSHVVVSITTRADSAVRHTRKWNAFSAKVRAWLAAGRSGMHVWERTNLDHRDVYLIIVTARQPVSNAKMWDCR